MARVTQNNARPQPTQRTSHTRMQNTDTQAPHARTTSRTAATTAHCAVITTCTPLRARHAQHGTQLRPPHTPPTENHTQSHTRPPRHTHVRAVRLPSVDGMLPESWLLLKSNDLQDTRTAIASQPPTPASRPQHSAAQRIASIISSQMKASQHTACYRSRTTPCASDSHTTQPDSPQVHDAVIPLDNAATLRRSRTSQRDKQQRHVRANKRSAHNNNTATANSE
jgi:hypothetical protein